MSTNELDQEFADLMDMVEAEKQVVDAEHESAENKAEIEEVETDNDYSDSDDAGEVDATTDVAIDGTSSDDEDEDELTLLRKQNQLLMEQLNVAAQQPIKTENNEQVEQLAKEVDASTLFGEWKFDEIIENEDSFKKFLGDFAKKISTHTEERLLQKLPTTVSKLTIEQISARETVTSFYDNNKQLAAVKPFVAKVVTTVASEHPEWDLSKVLEESAERAYKALGLKRVVEAQEKKPGAKKPAFAGPASGKRGVQNTDAGKTKLEKELEELMEL